MSKSRKILGAILALVFVLNVFAVSAFAAGALSYEADGHGYTQAWVVSAPQNVSGNQYQVTVSLATNYKVGPVSFFLEGVTSIDDIAIGTGYYAGSDKNGIGGNGLVLLTPNTMDTVPAREINGAVAVVTYTTANANGAVTIANNPKTAINPNGTLIAARVVDSETVNNANFVAGQTVTSITVGGDLPEPPPPAAADLQVKASATGVVIDTHKTFGGQYAGAVYGFAQTANNTFKNATYLNNALEASDGSTLTITPFAAGSYGTGTTVAVGGKTYVVVVFGDVDCNGLINANDTTAAKSAQTNASIAPNNSIKRMAANCQASNVAAIMHNINGNDVTPIKSHVGGTKIDMAALAQAHFKANNNYQ